MHYYIVTRCPVVIHPLFLFFFLKKKKRSYMQNGDTRCHCFSKSPTSHRITNNHHHILNIADTPQQVHVATIPIRIGEAGVAASHEEMG